MERKQHLTTITAWVSSYQMAGNHPSSWHRKISDIIWLFKRHFLDSHPVARFCSYGKTPTRLHIVALFRLQAPFRSSPSSHISWWCVPFLSIKSSVFLVKIIVSQIHRSMQKWPMSPNKQKLWACLKMRYTGTPLSYGPCSKWTYHKPVNFGALFS